MRVILAWAIVLVGGLCVAAQEPVGAGERRVALTEPAVALDGGGAPALEATLKTTALNGAPDTPVTNIRIVVKNSGTVSYAFVSGLVTFYDGAGVRCGEGLFNADALAVNESSETDTPGIRIRCSPATWRIVATNLLPRVAPNVTAPVGVTSGTPASRASLNLVISIDGEEHPIQLDKPMVLTLGDAQRTIMLREAP
ncbi:MAG: hypothetical protein M3R69_17590 [Acidobacteriota bacterium]|nr:hypothetical protein [Acidobacteriota bacterium]